MAKSRILFTTIFLVLFTCWSALDCEGAWLGGWSYRRSISINLEGGNDSYTKVLLTGEGVSGSSSIIDTGYSSTKTWTARGNAQLDRTQKKFGLTSIKLDGTGDWVDTPDHDDFNFGSGDFTIDTWVRFNALPTSASTGQIIFWLGPDTSNYFAIRLWTDDATAYKADALFYSGGSLQFFARYIFSSISTGTWYHFAFVRYGNTQKIYVNGVAGATSGSYTGSLPDYSTLAYVGCDNTGGTGTSYNKALNGWIDEFRVSKGIARWISNFTPPSKGYSVSSASDYQVPLLVGESSGASGYDFHCSGNVKSDFSDIRFTQSDGTTLLNYWIESISGTTPNGLAKIWVKFNSVSSPSSSLYVYYGNSGASSLSSITGTMIKGDDGSTGNFTEATSGSATISHASGQYKMTEDSVDDAFAAGTILSDFYFMAEIYAEPGSSTDANSQIYFRLLDSSTVSGTIGASGTVGGYRRITANRYVNYGTNANKLTLVYLDTSSTLYYWNGSAWQTTLISFDIGAINIIERLYSDNTWFYIDVLNASTGNTVITNTAVVPVASVQSFSSGKCLIFTEPFTDVQFPTINTDNFIVRKYIYSEPYFGSASNQETVPIGGQISIGSGGSLTLGSGGSITE